MQWTNRHTVRQTDIKTDTDERFTPATVVAVSDNNEISDCHNQLAYRESSGGTGQLMSSEPDKTKHLLLSQSPVVPCFPLHALLVALNRTTVDYFSLDVEGYELDVSIGADLLKRMLTLEFTTIR